MIDNLIANKTQIKDIKVREKEVMFLKKQNLKKLTNFRFSNKPYLLSDDITEEYKKIKELFYASIEIFTDYKTERLIDSVRNIKQLMSFYELSDNLMVSLVNEMFMKRFIDTIEKREHLFDVLNKLLKMFFLFDYYRHIHIDVFHDFSVLKLFHRKEFKEKISDKEILKLSTFSSLSMPMGRLFTSYFTAESYEVYQPIILRKRPTLFISDIKKEYFCYINELLIEHSNFKYLKIYLCGLYEKMYGDDTFDKIYNELKSREKHYYCDIIELK